MTYKILFVCLGNICRSPSAEGIMNHLIQHRQMGSEISCDSAGTSSYHIGSPPDSRMIKAASRQGISLSGQARQFQRQDFEAFDLILAMDRQNYDDIIRLGPSGQHAHQVRLMCEFCRHHDEKDVPDPYYFRDLEGFDYVINLLQDACEGLLEHLISERKISSGQSHL